MEEGKNILIVDDDPDFVDAIKTILEDAKYSVESAFTPKDGFRLWRRDSLIC